MPAPGGLDLHGATTENKGMNGVIVKECKRGGNAG